MRVNGKRYDTRNSGVLEVEWRVTNHSDVGSKTSGLNRNLARRTASHTLDPPTVDTLLAESGFSRNSSWYDGPPEDSWVSVVNVPQAWFGFGEENTLKCN
jgi:hypothetical protein